MLTTVRGHEGLVLSVAFSPDGRYIASSSANIVKIWSHGLEIDSSFLKKRYEKKEELKHLFHQANESIQELDFSSAMATLNQIIEEARSFNLIQDFNQAKEIAAQIKKLTPYIITIKDLPAIYDEISFNDILSKVKVNIQVNELRLLIERLILSGKLKGRIRGKYLVFLKEEPPIGPQKPSKVYPSEQLEAVALNILRGGDWNIENDQSVFNYKVKVRNYSQYVVSNIQIILTSIPGGLESQSDRYKLDTLRPNSFESPVFKLTAKESCVGDIIEGIVTYLDQTGSLQTVQIAPLVIKYVCNLLVPKQITEKDYKQKTAFMEEKKIIFNCDMPTDNVEQEIATILENNNFYLLEKPLESEDANFRELKGYAEGKYDKQDVGLSVVMQKIADQTTKLVIKAMSDREEKIIDLLKDFSTKCDHLKSVSDLSMECKNCGNIMQFQEYMKMKDAIVCEKCGEELKIPKYKET